MNKSDRYITSALAGSSILINYLSGWDNTFFFIMISIFTFSLTRDLLIAGPFIVLSTYVYINYFGLYHEGLIKRDKKVVKGGSKTQDASLAASELR